MSLSVTTSTAARKSGSVFKINYGGGGGGRSTISCYGKLMPPPSASLVNHIALDDEGSIKDMYRFGERLGAGNFGVVWHVTHVSTGERYACKMINKDKVPY